MVKKQQGSASELLLTFQGGQGEAAKTIDTYRTVYLLFLQTTGNCRWQIDSND